MYRFARVIGSAGCVGFIAWSALSSSAVRVVSCLLDTVVVMLISALPWLGELVFPRSGLNNLMFPSWRIDSFAKPRVVLFPGPIAMLQWLRGCMVIAVKANVKGSGDKETEIQGQTVIIHQPIATQ
jgi:hypothetical protein